MKIIDIDIVEFGGLLDRHYTLCEGLNIFEGENESGKSTLWLFIKFMLYGMPKKGTPEREKALNRASHRALGSMTVENLGKKYRIERSFSENSRGKVSVYDIDSGERVFDGEEVGEAMLGVPKEAFENSCLIAQGAAAELGGEKGAAAIRNLLTSADESVDVEKILKKLDTLRVVYRHRNGKGGKLYEMSEEINRLRTRLDAATESRLRISELEKKIEENSDGIEESERLLGEAQGVTEQLRRAEILNRFRRLDTDRDRLKDLTKKTEELIDVSPMADRLPNDADVANLRALADSAERASVAYRETDIRLSVLNKETRFDDEKIAVAMSIEELGGPDKPIRDMKRYSAMTVIGIILAAISFPLILIPIIGIIIAICLLAGGVALLSVGLVKRSKLLRMYGNRTKALSAYLSECREELERKRLFESENVKLEAELSAKREQVNFVFSELRKVLDRSVPESENSIASARAEALRLEEYIKQYSFARESEERLRMIISNEEKALSVYDEKALRDEASELDTLDASGEQVNNKRRFYEERLRIQRAKDRELRTELINLKAVSDDPSQLADKIATLNEKYSEVEAYHDALVTAIEGMELASAAMRGNITPTIGKEAGRMLEYLSESRYGDVNMNKHMELTLVDKDHISTTDSMMSGGTKDAAYIALRIALMRQIFNVELPPLIMDECLCHLDDRRLSRMLTLICGFCDEGAQCVIFTCHSREAELCANMNISTTVYRL